MAWIGSTTPGADRFVLIAAAAVVFATIAALVTGLTFGWILAIPWTAGCFYAAATGRSVLWGFLVVTPLALISWNWLWHGFPAAEDAFGLMWPHIYAFTGASFVTAATGILFFIQPRLWTPRPRHKNRAKT